MNDTASTTRFLWVLALLIGALCAGADDASRTLVGDYEWEQRGHGGDLRAIFTPTADDAWAVAFHFRFRGEKHVYEGTAEGSLSEGELKGTVKNESKRRTFTFQGAFQDGEFRGTHAEVEGNREVRTGTLKLKAAAGSDASDEPVAR